MPQNNPHVYIPVDLVDTFVWIVTRAYDTLLYAPASYCVCLHNVLSDKPIASYISRGILAQQLGLFFFSCVNIEKSNSSATPRY